MTGLADCNNFFVSCERSVDPTLEGKPVVVLSNNDGCVIARSNEAKRMGIKMGQPTFEIRELIESGRVIAYSGNHLLYREKSMRIHDIFRRYVPATLDYSVDESFLDLSGIPEYAIPEIGEEIRRVCMEEERIPVTIGFAPTKTLAKIATEVGKKQGKGVVMIPRAEEFEPYMEKMGIGELWGVGRRLSKRLYIAGVYTIGDFARREPVWVRSTLGVLGEKSWRELHGESCIELEHLGRKIQDSISETRTFPEDIDDFDWLRSRVAIYAAHVAKRLRRMNAECGEISVFLHTNRFHTERGRYAPEARMELEVPTDDSSEIVKAAVACLENIYDSRFKYKRGGVTLMKIIPRRSLTPSLFENIESGHRRQRRSRSLMAALDSLNTGAGPEVVKLASQITGGIAGHNDGYSSSFGPPKV